MSFKDRGHTLESSHFGWRRSTPEPLPLEVAAAAAAHEPAVELLLLLQGLHPVPAAVGRQQLPQQRQQQPVGGVVLARLAPLPGAVDRPGGLRVLGRAGHEGLERGAEGGHQRRLAGGHGEVDPVVHADDA